MSRRHDLERAMAVLLCVGSLVGCAGAAPFTTPSPALATLEAEEPFLYQEPDRAIAGLSETELSLAGRIGNLFNVYEAELANAEAAQGGILNGFLSVTSLVLPLAGTVSAFALSNPDDVETVTAATGIATTLVVAINLIAKPKAKSDGAAACETFLRNALESLGQRWDRDNLDRVTGTPDDWRLYLAVRGSLDAGRDAAC